MHLSKPIYTFVGFCSLIFFLCFLINISLSIIDYTFTKEKVLKANLKFVIYANRSTNLQFERKKVNQLCKC